VTHWPHGLAALAGVWLRTVEKCHCMALEGLYFSFFAVMYQHCNIERDDTVLQIICALHIIWYPACRNEETRKCVRICASSFCGPISVALPSPLTP